MSALEGKVVLVTGGAPGIGLYLTGASIPVGGGLTS
jgi:NAD(P)-dependent dehydrogenase (short-subunit alcohol dehydrogenase family)